MAQAGYEDDRVMLQGFYWESYRHGDTQRFGSTYGSVKWYDIVAAQADAIRDARFDMIWLPPPAFAGQSSAGYNPSQYFRLDNSFGSLKQHRAMLETLLGHGVEPIADIVVNHRNGNTKWYDFVNPDWDTRAITANDEVFSNPNSDLPPALRNQRGAPEQKPGYRTDGNYAYPDFRDIDHTNPVVRRDVIRFLLSLKSLGYRGWRYDMVHGYNAEWLALYNKRSNPTFSVGEYDWDRQGEQRGWIWDTATSKSDPRTASSVFDFKTQFTLKDNKGRYDAWYAFGNGIGLMGDNTDGMPWKNRAVTFLENHDTGYRTNDDGSCQKDHCSDNFANGWEVEQGYAYILTHPGVPTVYWKHYFDWGSDLREKIKALINARKVAGVHAGSPIHTQDNARTAGVYAAMIEGHNGRLYVRIGGSDEQWQPSHSNYGWYRDYAHGANWKVWVSIPGNPEVQQAPVKAPLPIPAYKPATGISIPGDWVNL